MESASRGKTADRLERRRVLTTGGASVALKGLTRRCTRNTCPLLDIGACLHFVAPVPPTLMSTARARTAPRRRHASWFIGQDGTVSSRCEQPVSGQNLAAAWGCLPGRIPISTSSHPLALFRLLSASIRPHDAVLFAAARLCCPCLSDDFVFYLDPLAPF